MADEIWKDIPEYEGLYQGGVSTCCNNKAKTTLGYHWEFIGGELNE